MVDIKWQVFWWTMGVYSFYGKGPQPLLGAAASWVACGESIKWWASPAGLRHMPQRKLHIKPDACYIAAVMQFLLLIVTLLTVSAC
jgi:hypothetical protein